jgi:Tol biopolymer transport system component
MGPSSRTALVASLADGRVEQITKDNKSIYGSPIWTKDGAEIFFSSDRAALASIWRISRGGGVPQPIPGAGPIARYPSLSPSGTELAYEHVDERQDLWHLELKDASHARGPASIIVTNNKTYNLMPQFSPDGRKIAFQTGRSGYSELWVCDADGSHLLQVTALQGFAGSPRWSADGRYLAFDYRPRNHSEIHVVEASGGRPHPVAAFSDSDNVIPNWSRDGHWIYFSSNHQGKVFQIWKIAVRNGVAAEPAPLPVTKNGGNASSESLDGRQLFYTKFSEAGIWAMPVDGGRENIVWRGPGPEYWSNWAPAKDGAYFTAPSGASSEIEFLDFKTKRISHIAKLEKPSFYGFTVSPDGRSIVYSQWDRSEHNILVMKNFR